MNSASGDTFQVDTAMEAFYNGGWFGLGPGEGIAKPACPTATPISCLRSRPRNSKSCFASLMLFAFIVVRALSRPMRPRTCSRCLGFGPRSSGVQAAINMSVDLQLIPAKGMTLPFISYGGSSMVSLAYGVGMMLALTRQRPSTEIESIAAATTARGYV